MTTPARRTWAAIVRLLERDERVFAFLLALVMVGGFEALRHTAGLQSIFGEGFDPALYRMLLFGIAMVGIMVWRPRGIVGSRSPTIVLDETRPVRADLVKEGRA